MGFRFAIPVLAALGLWAADPAPAALSAAIRDFDGSPAHPAPALLSHTGLYTDFTARPRAIAIGIHAFRINSPLWSDGAAKDRFLSPPPGQTIVPTDTDAYVYPEGTVFIKNFAVDTIYGDSASRILAETRFLVLHAASDATGNHPWHGISYRWARDQSEAYLVDQDLGENLVINVRMGGLLRGKRWTFPSKHQCNTCHFNRGILGFITPQLNRPSAANAAVNQLQALADAGVLSANPVAGKPNAFRWRGLADTAASQEVRARSYFASNCSHCHGNGPSPGDHIFDYFHAETSIDQGPNGDNGAYLDKLTHQGGDGFPRFIYKGWPESSYVLKRMLVRQDFGFNPTEQMPTLATFQPDSAGLRLLKDWICSQGNRPVTACRLPEVQADAAYWDAPAAIRHTPQAGGSGPSFRLTGGLLICPGAPATAGQAGFGDIRLLDLRGRPIGLTRLGPGLFRPQAKLAPGLYLVVWTRGRALVRNLP